MRRFSSVLFLLLSYSLNSYADDAEKWVSLGLSDIGQHEVDTNSLQWISPDSIFNITTRVIEKSHAQGTASKAEASQDKLAAASQIEWVTTMTIDCKANTFSYTNGRKYDQGKLVGGFNKARPAEAIGAGSMPDQLKQAYCPVAEPAQDAANESSSLLAVPLLAEPMLSEPTSESTLESVENEPPPGKIEWQSIGKSAIAEVFYDRKSIRRSQDGSRFIAHTKVIPFASDANGKDAEAGDITLSTLSFDCNDHTFMVVRMSKLKDDQLVSVFDTPQPPAHTDKIATIQTLANKFCKASDEPPTPKTPEQLKKDTRCANTLSQVELLQNKIQQDIDDGGLLCKQVKSYVKQIQQLAKAVKRDDCPIDGMDSLAQDVKSEACH
ncbi:MAG: hypothetical protein ACAH07_09530 [Methylophilaceae bacterium]|nr:hypothetical protein [Methyloradius sp.]